MVIHLETPLTLIQEMYQNLFNRTMDLAYENTKEIMKKMFSKCKSTDAWQEIHGYHFHECTDQIAASNARILSSLTSIEAIASATLSGTHLNSNMNIQNELGELMEDVEIFPFSSVGLELATNDLKQKASTLAAG